jgi:hypothetical protein
MKKILLMASVVFSMLISTNITVWAAWPFQTGGPTSSPAIADLSGDGNLEMIFGSTDKNLYCVNDGGQLIWQYQINGNVQYSPAIADIDGDGNLEVLVGSDDYNLYCIDKNGQLKWKFLTGFYIYSSPTIADIDNDGNLEVLVGSWDHNLYCVDKNGQLKWKYATGDWIYSSPAVADIDNDGNLEVLVSSYDGKVYCINKSGQKLWDYATQFAFESSPAIADIDNDGNLEIIIGSPDNYLYCLDKSGQLKWKYFAGGGVFSSPAIADIDKDGNLEILVGSWDHFLYCVDKNGIIKWSYLTGDTIYSSPAIADIDNDGNLEVLVGSCDSNLYCIDKNGQLKWKYLAGDSIYTSPSLADLNADGSLEILFGSRTDARLYCLNKDGQPFIPSPKVGSITSMPWPMFRHDLRHTGLYASPEDHTLPTTPIVADEGGFTRNTRQLYSSWISQDKESGIREYQYKITEDCIDGNIIRDWVSTGDLNYVTASGLSLFDAKIYFFGVKAKNGTGLWSQVGYSDGITVDNAPPRGTILINNNAKATNSIRTTLNISAYDNLSGMGEGAKMQFSNNCSIFSAPEPYNTAKSWIITSGDGVKTVYARFKDAIGNWSGYTFDTILLDTVKPNIIHTPITKAYRNKPIIFGAMVTDKGSGVDSVKVVFTNPGIKQLEMKFTGYSFQAVMPADQVKGDMTYSIRAEDKAGNKVSTSSYYIKVVR